MDPLQDRQSSFLMGNSNMKEKNRDGEDARAPSPSTPPPPQVPLPGKFLPYKGSSVYPSKYPPTAANPKGYSSESCSAWHTSSKHDKWTDDHIEPYKFGSFTFATIVASPSTPPPPQVPLPGQFLPYKGSPIYPSKYPPTAANPKGYSSESCCTWHASSKYDKWTDDHIEPYKFGRFTFAAVVSLIISLSMASLAIWLLFGVDVSIFQVSSLSVSNLVISHSINIQATWRANITITNPNIDLKGRGDLLMATVLYKDHPLAKAHVTPKNTQVHNEEGQNQFSSVFKINNDTNISKDDVAAEVTQALKSGVIHVSLRIASGAQIISNSGWSQDIFKIFCENLKLLISPAGNGHLAQDSPRGCLIFKLS